MSDPPLSADTTLNTLRESMLMLLEKDHPKELASLHEISATFKSRGFLLFLVGGAVRNLAIGKDLKDFDLASDALPNDVMAMFKHVIPTGIQHGTVTLVYKGVHFEITTFRVDGDYSDARRPDSVTFTRNIAEDLKRRDFTINAMALDLETGEVLDPQGGIDDLKGKRIRTVGSAVDRFSEDGLRIVRAIRFASQLEFQIDSQTLTAIPQCLSRLENVSIERFRDEFIKILGCKRPLDGLYFLRSLGIFALFAAPLGQLLPNDFALSALGATLVQPDLVEARLGALLSKLGPVEAEKLCAHLRLPNTVIKKTVHFISICTIETSGTESEYQLRQIASRITREYLVPGLALWTAIHTARSWLTNNDLGSIQNESIEFPIELGTIAIPSNVVTFRERVLHIVELSPPLAIRDLAVNGTDLIARGIEPGRGMGTLLNHLLDEVLRDPDHNTVDFLSAEALRFWSENKLS